MATPNINHPTGNTNSNNSTPLQSNTTLATVDIAAAVDVATMIASQVADTVVKETIKKAVNEIIQQEKFPKPSERLQRIAEPSVNSYLNLYNNHRSVLGPDKVLRLEQKLAELRKYSQVIADDLKVLIVDKTNGITPKQGTLLQTKILEILENFVSSNQDTEVPRFLETSYGFKSLKVVCANAYTLKWLKETIAKLKPEPWKGARLEVTFMSTYSVYSTVSNRPTTKSKPTDGRVKFAIPKTTKTVTFDEIKKQIEIHNVPVKTVSWKELHKIEKPAYTMYFVSMNKESIDEIRTKGNRLFYLLGTIKFAPLNQNDEIAYNEMIIAAKKKVAADKRAAAAKTGTAGPGAPANPGAGNATPATKKATVPSKLKIVKNEKAKIVKSPWDSKEIQNLVKKVATDISNEVVDATVRKALASTEFTKDILNATVRTAVKSAELQKKYPPLPENMQKLSEPTTATYIALYNKHRNVLKPKAVGVVKQKITDYLQKIEEISLRDKLDRAAQKDSRKKRKTEAIKVQKENKFANFCDEKCDEMFETFLSKFTDTFKAEREVPKPLILGPSSRRLYQTTQQQIKKLLGLKTNPETAKAPESNDAEKVVRGQTSKQIPDTNKVSDVGSTQIAQSRKNIPETLNAARAGDTSVADPLVAETGDVKETEENTEIVDRLSYFIMEFVQNSLVEAL